ncbi:hypothetical protein MPTK1_3g16590 [Marchantia polymorpha subsp. ruderalis]|nr:hypothetical protein MARPO_0004s0012 [Marchantia polymorpha]BBN05871.1 hypothetical protein Mp_3g16590 [Marchantia polymorpha subsp. ruderalis]|eukprot:PTQ48705.1 hypothetical protein MARPO_0004s0012 [Marchantia polymorpha]
MSSARSARQALAFMVLAALASSCYGAICNEGDQRALVQLRDAFLNNTPGAGDFFRWLGSNCCNWQDVTCRESDGRVVTLRLTGTGSPGEDLVANPAKRGQWEAALASLTQLTGLAFGNVKLGYFPKRLPATLTSLSFFDCEMEGSMPVEVGQLSRLESFQLIGKWGQVTPGAKRLSGVIPSSICNLTKLTALIIAQHSFTGNFPDCIHRMTALFLLSGYRNRFNTPLPASLGRLSSLVSFQVFENEIPGTIPPSLGNISTLGTLDLHQNRLTGTIPREFSSLKNLAYLSLSNNLLHGKLYPELSGMRSLGTFEAENNFLYGEIPSTFGNFTAMVGFRLRKNLLSGSIPATLGDMCYGRFCSIDIGQNRLTGTIPGGLIGIKKNPATNFDTANDIFLDYNFLTGPLPAYTGQTLRQINASHNQITGGFPLSWARITQVDLTYNRLDSLAQVGALPAESQIFELLLGHNRLRGSFPSWLTGLMKTVSRLDLSWNSFSGALPGAVFENPNIYSVDVSHNYFYSQLPNESSWQFQFRNGLIFLDLHHNSFYGPVPSLFVSRVLRDFIRLDLSENRFWGRFPDAFGVVGSFNAKHVDLSDNFFSGPLPVTAGRLQNLEFLDLSNNRFGGRVPGSYSQLKKLKYLNVTGNNLIEAL